MTGVVSIFLGASVGLVVWTAAALAPQRPGFSRRDRWRCFSDLPEILELLALCLSSGQSLRGAWASTVGSAPAGPLRGELERTTRALELGRSPSEAMSELAARLGEPRAAMALALVAQAMARGNPLEPVLLSQASSLRRLRMLEIERRAQTAPLRMMAPVFGLIFPAVLLLLLAPVLLSLAQGGPLF